jgi:PAS domain S-box-containing protein
LRRHYRPIELPVIMVTVKRQSNDIVSALKIGANDYITKPVDFKILMARIETQIKLKRTEKAYQDIKRNLEQLVAKRTSELDQTNRVLQRERTRFQSILSSSPAITYVTSPEERHCCSFVSENLSQIMGYQPEEMTGDPAFWFNHVHPEDIASDLKGKIEKTLAQGGGTLEYRFLHKEGTYRWISDQCRVIYEDNTPVEIIGSWIDITEALQLSDDLDYKSSHDELTGLMNRKEFERELNVLLQKMESTWTSTSSRSSTMPMVISPVMN